MNLMLPTARRKDGEKQPCIKIWKFDLRIPFIHYEWEIPEMIQGLRRLYDRLGGHCISAGPVRVYL